MDLMKQLEKLDSAQLGVALKVIEEAERQGVNPELVLPLVAIESEFGKGHKSPKGAIGVMQLMPKTAKDLGVDPHNEDENIAGGIKLIKQLSEHKDIGGDPYKILVGYNAGPNSTYFKTGNFEDLPKETQEYLVKAHEYYGDDLPSATAPTRNEAGEIVPESQYGATKVGDEPMTQGEKDERRSEAGALGGIAGGAIGTFKAPVIGLIHRISKMLPKDATPEQAAKIADIIMRQSTIQGGVQSGGIPTAGTDAGRMAAGETGVMPYNYAKAAGLTDIEAGQALDMTKQEGGVHDLATKRREGMNRVNQIAPGQFVENPNYGGLLTSSGSAGGGPRQSYAFKPPEIENGQVVSQGGMKPIPKAQPVSAAPPHPPKQPGGFSKGMAWLAGSSPVKGALTGYGALYNAQDAYQKMLDKDIVNSVISGAGAVGDVASLAPQATKLGARISPAGAALSASAEASRRLQNKDYIGAGTSALGAIAPYAAPFVFGPEVGIPVGIATALGAPMANELKDYLQRGGDQTPESKKPFRNRGFGLD